MHKKFDTEISQEEVLEKFGLDRLDNEGKKIIMDTLSNTRLIPYSSNPERAALYGMYYQKLIIIRQLLDQKDKSDKLIEQNEIIIQQNNESKEMNQKIINQNDKIIELLTKISEK